MYTISPPRVVHSLRLALIALGVLCARAGFAQTSYSIAFTNNVGCDIKICAYVDQTADACASPYNLACTLVTSGNTVTYNFTVPAGHVFCHYTFKQDTNNPNAIIWQTGPDPCSWNFAGVDLCNTGTSTVDGKGNCTSARFSL